MNPSPDLQSKPWALVLAGGDGRRLHGHCGWSDLGTPQRIAVTLRHLADEGVARIAHRAAKGYVNLADQYARLARVGAVNRGASQGLVG